MSRRGLVLHHVKVVRAGYELVRGLPTILTDSSRSRRSGRGWAVDMAFHARKPLIPLGSVNGVPVPMQRRGRERGGRGPPQYHVMRGR
jgi:hypothetical protein